MRIIKWKILRLFLLVGKHWARYRYRASPLPFFLSYPLPFYFYGISLEFEITNRQLRFGLNYCIVNDAWNDPSVDACSTDQPILCAFSFLNRRILLITFQGNLSSFFFLENVKIFIIRKKNRSIRKKIFLFILKNINIKFIFNECK